MKEGSLSLGHASSSAVDGDGSAMSVLSSLSSSVLPATTSAVLTLSVSGGTVDVVAIEESSSPSSQPVAHASANFFGSSEISDDLAGSERSANKQALHMQTLSPSRTDGQTVVSVQVHSHVARRLSQ